MLGAAGKGGDDRGAERRLEVDNRTESAEGRAAGQGVLPSTRSGWIASSEAAALAVQEAVRDHKRAGNPIDVWQDGQVVWNPSELIEEGSARQVERGAEGPAVSAI